MKLLVAGATAALRELNSPHFGALFVPDGGNNPAEMSGLYGVDNGAYMGFKADKFLALLRRLSGRLGCVFVVTPDDVTSDTKVGRPAETLRLFRVWAPVVRQHGFPLAFVAQDGVTVRSLPWDDFDVLFLGGSTRWKLGPEARTLVGYAKALGKGVHMGRVNSWPRIRYAFWLGCDWCDGSGFSRWSRARLPLAIQWIEKANRQMADLPGRATVGIADTKHGDTCESRRRACSAVIARGNHFDLPPRTNISMQPALVAPGLFPELVGAVGGSDV